MRRLLFAILACVVLLSLEARADDFTPGQPIEYLDSGVWEPGSVIKILPHGTQVLIHRKPSQFFPEGPEAAWPLDKVRPRNGTAAPQPSHGNPESGGTLPAHHGTGLMTQQEITDLLRAGLGSNPWGPNRDRVLADLVAQLKARGVDFHYVATSRFGNDTVGKYGLLTDVVGCISDNYGPPPTPNFYAGHWRMSKIAGTVDFVKGNDVYRKGEVGAKMGLLDINLNGTYSWRPYANDAPIHGSWRAASPAEMSYQGGAGLVLLRAKGGVDWIVMRDRVTTLPADWITVAQLTSRQTRESGTR